MACAAGVSHAADTTVDWLMDQGTAATRPTTAPATRPDMPFTTRPAAEGRTGTITLSDGTRLTGVISTTPEKPLRLWDESAETYRDIPLRRVRSLEAQVVWERDEPEWHFTDSGSDKKEFTGKTYPARELVYKMTLADGRQFTGGIVAPLYLEQDGRQRLLVLHKRDKGPVGQTLKELVYVLRVELE